MATQQLSDQQAENWGQQLALTYDARIVGQAVKYLMLRLETSVLLDPLVEAISQRVIAEGGTDQQKRDRKTAWLSTLSSAVTIRVDELIVDPTS